MTALTYVTVLALTSNDFSQRFLGRAWSKVHERSRTLFVLAVIHAAIGVYVLSETKVILFPYFLWLGVSMTIGLELADIIATVRQSRRRRGDVQIHNQSK